MRLSKASTLLLLLGAIGSGAALANCSAGEAEDDDNLSADSPEVTGIYNAMGLGLRYDEGSGTVRATVRRKLRAGEKLVLRVRRGRLSADSQNQLDCSQLTEAPAMPMEENATKTVYQGPHVDPSLLASVYDENWIMGNITPQMLDQLQREGADSIVEACILKSNGQVRARVQTTLQYAWDEQVDEATGYTSSSSTGGTSLNGEINFMAGDGGTNGGAPRAGRPIQSMEKYAELCVAELGEIPFFKKIANGKYDTFDCRDFKTTAGEAIPGVEGAMIPQSVSTADGADATPRECDDRNVNRYNCFKKCDKPEWLFQSCEPGPTVTTAKNDKGTHWTLLCRSVGERGGNETVEKLTKTKHFNDIAMIGHNPVTGKSCFFQNKIFDGTDGAKVPHPADLEKSRHIWDAPKGYCMRCHSAEAFIHTPWIDGAKRRDGTPVVPMMGKHPDFEISWNASPYSIVNRAAQARGNVGGGTWDLPKHLVSEGADACLSCHRIGGGDGMRRFPMWATGEEGLDRSPSGTSGPLQPKLTDWAKKFENAHWMPMRLDGIDEQNYAQSKYAKAVEHIKACAANANAAGCEWAAIPER
jgi:hypothetical protein